MSTSPNELLDVALDLLPELPCSIEVFSQDGGSFVLTLSSSDGDLLYGYGSREHVRDGLSLEYRPRNAEGDGHNIRFTVRRSFFQSGLDLLVHLSVTGIDEHFATRGAPRAPLASAATVRVLYGSDVERDTVAEIRIADMSTTGLAFITERMFRPGDVLELRAPLPDRVVRLEARVVTSVPAIYGRNRVGCEITAILEADRHSIGMLALLAEGAGSEDDRRPDLRRQLERARNRQTLGDRQAPRYHG
jgi:hypothetical protein